MNNIQKLNAYLYIHEIYEFVYGMEITGTDDVISSLELLKPPQTNTRRDDSAKELAKKKEGEWRNF